MKKLLILVLVFGLSSVWRRQTSDWMRSFGRVICLGIKEDNIFS